jgi:steroid 5-alpha reductase family enzyme
MCFINKKNTSTFIVNLINIERNKMTKRTKSRLIILAIYLVACTLGFWVSSLCGTTLLMKSAVAVAVTVAVIFAGSLACNNSSVFDPYWSIAPPLMVLFYFNWSLDSANLGWTNTAGLWGMIIGGPRIGVLFLLTLAYSIRLTWNFLRGWPGLAHEDWRYADFRKNTGKAYWLVSFTGIHYFPALMVFGGTLSIWVAVVYGYSQIGLTDLAAIVVTGYAILLETASDKQMRKFLAENRGAGKTMDQGLWSLSRHPNYFGEIMFWWGLYLFALAANHSLWWVVAGPLAITLMFIFASIPMIEKRMLERRKDYAGYMEKVSMLVPWRRKKVRK